MFEHLALIIAVNLALYLKTLRFKFVSDDFSVWKNPPVFRNPWHKAWLRFIGACKLLSLSVHFKRHPESGKLIVGLIKTEEFEHLLAILIHIAACIAIYFAFGANHISWVAAMLYSTNPVNNQATIWPGGRGYVLPILSLMLAIAVPYIAPVTLFFCSWFTVGFLYPLALIGLEKWWLLWFMPIVWGWHFMKFRKAVRNKQVTETFVEDKIVHPRKIILGIKTFGFYLALCLIPFRITFYHNFLQSLAGSLKHKGYTLCRYFWIGLAAGITWCVYVYFAGWTPLAWATFAFGISIAPFCNVIRANQEIAERFAAPANVFLMFALAQLIAPYPVLITAFVVFYATRTFYTLKMYQDEYWITECAVVEDQHAWWAWHCRAMKRWDTQSYKEALILWVMAELISPKEFKVLMNISTCLRLLGSHPEADQYLKAAEENIVAGQEAQAQEFIAQHRKGKLPILL